MNLPPLLSTARAPVRAAQIMPCDLTIRGLIQALLIFALLQPPASLAGLLRAGAATSVITPHIGTPINGGTSPVISTHVHDELHARALVLDDSSRRLAIVLVDVCLLDRPFIDLTKELLQQQTGLLPTNVLIAATHTHSAGSVIGAHLTEPDPAYRAWLPQRIVDSVRRALYQLAPAQIAWGRTSLPQHVFCRRILVRPGIHYTNLLQQTGDRAKMNWSSPEPAVDGEFAGPTDPEVSILSLQHADGRPLALLANYSLHYVGGVGPGHLSADYFGAFADKISHLLRADRQDPPFVGILSNGTSGDINNLDYRAPRLRQTPYEQIHRVADDLANAVFESLAAFHYTNQLTLGSSFTEVPVAVRKPAPSELERARAIVGSRGPSQLRTWTEIYAREQLILHQWPDRVSLPLQILRIGDLAIAGWPGEIFAVSGLELKRRSPVQPLFNISLANGWYGYIPPPEQHALGAYETWRARTSPLETQATVRMIDAFLSLLP